MNDLWKFDLVNNTWEHLNGNQTIDVLPDYTIPKPGSTYDQAMVIDSTDSYLFVFGGWGSDGSTNGIYL